MSRDLQKFLKFAPKAESKGVFTQPRPISDIGVRRIYSKSKLLLATTKRSMTKAYPVVPGFASVMLVPAA
jgi:hypothetical protein